MNYYIKTMKDWWKLAKPSKKYYFLVFFLVVLTQITLLIVAPIFTAKVTVSITNQKYTRAIIYLCVGFSILLARKTFWHFEYMCYAPLIKSTYNRLNNEFVNKALHARSANFKTTSKEQILNILHTDNFTVAEFGEKTSIAFARLLIVLVNIIVIFTINAVAGAIVVVADILDFMMLAWASNRRQKWHKLTRQSHDEQYEKFSEIIDAREAISDLGIEKRVKQEYNDVLDTYIKRLHKRDFWDSIYANYYAAFYEFLILVATIISVILVTKGLSIETYFIIVSYISNGISNTKDLFSVIKEFDNVNTASSRVKTVLNFTERDEVEVGKNTLTDIMGNLCFSNVSYKKDDEGNPWLKNFDILFNENQTCLILGTRSCGKRTIFNMLRRAIEPDDGQITLSGVNLYEFTTKSYLENFSYVTTHPTFFKGSIMKNLQLKEKNKKVIYQTCRELGIYNYIMGLQKKFNTDISTIPYDKLYLIGLARAILTGSQVLAIYEFPDALTEKEKKNIKQILHAMQGTRTILIFSAKDYCQDISDKIITIEKGEITNISYTQNNKADII